MYEFSTKTFYVILVIALMCFILSISNWFYRPHSSQYPDGVIPERKIELHINWHNHSQVWRDQLTRGLGEQGEPAYIEAKDKNYENLLFMQNGFNAYLSDRISLDRTIGDTKYAMCKNKLYLKKLPAVSIIITFRNEHWSTLLRSIHSIINRTPLHLIEEVLLIDDASNDTTIYDYIRSNLPKVKLIEMDDPVGPITAKMKAARMAKSKILVFLESHIEVNYNWLAPIIEPIVFNHKHVVSPTIDHIDKHTFEYRPQNLNRGAFDWDLNYQTIPPPHEMYHNRTEHFTTPIITGPMFAINSSFFFGLGGFDEKITQMENSLIELSFKIWRCGGVIINDPCSRIGLLMKRKHLQIEVNYKDNKRIAQAWMEEYSKYVYSRHPENYNNVNIAFQKNQSLVKKRYRCQSFNWYLTIVANDSLKYYPPIEKPMESGLIQNMANPKLCLERSHKENLTDSVKLSTCSKDRSKSNQNWMLSWRSDLRSYNQDYCITFLKNISAIQCQGRSNQVWQYHNHSKWLTHKNLCLEANLSNNSILLNDCDDTNLNMKWNFGDFVLININNVIIKRPEINKKRLYKKNEVITLSIHNFMPLKILKSAKKVRHLPHLFFNYNTSSNSMLNDYTSKIPINNSTDINNVYTDGLIQSLANKVFCLDAVRYLKKTDTPLDYRISLERCSDPATPVKSQRWALSFSDHIKLKHINNSPCLSILPPNILSFDACHTDEVHVNQLWHFDLKKQYIYQKNTNLCLSANIEKKSVHAITCNEDDKTMKWFLLGYYNKTAIKIQDVD